MAGSSWEPLSPFLPFLYRASLFFYLSECILPSDASPFLCPVCSDSWNYHVSIFPLGRPEVHVVGSQSQQVFQQLCSVALPSSQEEGGRAWGASLCTCQGSHPQLPGILEKRPGRFSHTRGTLACRFLAGGTSLHTRLRFPSFLFPKRGSHFGQAQLGQGRGGAAEPGRRQGSVGEEEISHPVKAPPTSRAAESSALSLFAAFSLSFFLSSLLPLPCPVLYQSHFWPGYNSLGALSPGLALRPFWPLPMSSK